jgi:polyhydroxyalkanoate synthesis regulator phasin|tara:strand:+ start:226 stop:483 length:258 start_codon:yes stop_codon:yes gene_type:complete
MKIFVYKALFVFVCIFILFQLTIGMQIKQFNHKLEEFQSKENIEKIKEKLRDELRNAISKENYLTPDDAKLINEFINKLKKELSN